MSSTETKRFIAYLDPEQVAWIDAQASKAGVQRSVFMRALVQVIREWAEENSFSVVLKLSDVD